MTSAPDPSAFGQATTLTATVTAVSPGVGAPTGSVDFFDTSTNTDLGTVPLSSGSAVLNTSVLAFGSHTIKVVKQSGTYMLVDAFRVHS